MDSWWEYGNNKMDQSSWCWNSNSRFGFWWYTSSVTNATEHYDGSAWTAGGNMGTARYHLAGAGTQTAGLGFGGYDGSELMLPNIMMAQHGHLVGIWQHQDIT
jgi:hypothetical protein